jgi:hypothetical protein
LGMTNSILCGYIPDLVGKEDIGYTMSLVTPINFSQLSLCDHLESNRFRYHIPSFKTRRQIRQSFNNAA